MLKEIKKNVDHKKRYFDYLFRYLEIDFVTVYILYKITILEYLQYIF